ncbi:hypothetical protein Syun_029348 [Stephania yunnanensis]|uniref:Uncharacterized protein n=1 Tax=Stephania yunnanensis TaxID=152371 RepID=A0AAP0HH83_9MAGN
MSHPQVPKHEGNQQFHQSLSLEDMVMQIIYQIRENVQDFRRAYHNIRQLDFSCPGSKDLVTDLDRYIASRQRNIDEAELCSTQLTFNPEEDVSVDTLTNLEVHDVTQVEDYLIETSDECEVFQIEPEIGIALNDGEDEMNIDVNSDKPEKPIESEEDQQLMLVQPPTLPCTFGTPYKGGGSHSAYHVSLIWALAKYSTPQPLQELGTLVSGERGQRERENEQRSAYARERAEGGDGSGEQHIEQRAESGGSVGEMRESRERGSERERRGNEIGDR